MHYKRISHRQEMTNRPGGYTRQEYHILEAVFFGPLNERIFANAVAKETKGDQISLACLL